MRPRPEPSPPGGNPGVRARPEPHGLARRLAELGSADVVSRVWKGDHTVWGRGPDEIANRLGWLRAPQTMRRSVGSLIEFAKGVQDDGCNTVALLGMGGSSLGPETLARVAAPQGTPRFVVLDSTHPSSVARTLDSLDLRHTLFIVSTKSGTTAETLALFHIAHQRASLALGGPRAGARFVAITDPESPLVSLARDHGFRRVFLNDPTFGGRYAALSLVGLVPAVLLGLDPDQLLDSAAAMSSRCSPETPLERNPAALLAALLAAHRDEGRDKATFVLPEEVQSFGDWCEQLIAESTGKGGTGIVPIVGEPLAAPSEYGEDRVFLLFGSQESPQPSVKFDSPAGDALGGQFYLWEMATALLGHLLGVNPFDQPDVEAAKHATRDILAAQEGGGMIRGAECSSLASDALRATVALARPGDYIALLAYLDATPDTTAALLSLRRSLRAATRCATSLGFGPRYLHSTGQLHKGDAGRGVFLEFVDTPSEDVAIPHSATGSLGQLVRAQALGDVRALAERGRRVRAFDLGEDPAGALRSAAGAL